MRFILLLSDLSQINNFKMEYIKEKEGFMKFFIFLVGLNLFSMDPSHTMRTTYYDIYAMSEKIDKESCKAALPIFKRIKKKTDKLAQHYFLKTEGYRTSFKIFDFYLNELQNICSKNNQNLSYRESTYRNLLKSCFQCHSSDQMTRNSPPIQFGKNKVERFLHFMISRNYDQALKELDKYFSNPTLDEYYDLLLLEQDLFLKYKLDPNGLLARYSKRKTYSKYQKTINAWKKDLVSLNHFKKNNDALKSSKKIIVNRTGLLAKESELISLKYLFGYLHNIMHSVEPKKIPEILYTLGSLENRINHDIYSTNNVYLIDCIISYPKSSFAKLCYEEIVRQIEFSFTGSAGKNIPEDITLFIEKLKKKVK